MQDFTFTIVGSGGDGAVVAGDLAAMASAGHGLHVIKTEAYGPQIRGGESSSTVRVSTTPIAAQGDAIDVLVVLRFADFARFRSEMTLREGCVVLHEPDDPPPAEIASLSCEAVPFAQLARDAGAPSARNIAALGVLASMLSLPADGIRDAIRRRFAKKGATVVDANLRAFDRGLESRAPGGSVANAHVVSPQRPREHGGGRRLEATSSGRTPKLLMSGNEATAFAALHAGCSFFAGYPITPSSEILHLLSEWLPRIGGTCLQTEDELAAIGAVVGASFAGAKAMTATSGPGLSLMSEMLGLSSIAEIPSVTIDVQRGGPSTGIPTKSEQSDLFHAVYGGHGDMPRVVLAPCDVEDAFHTTVDAFNIAEEFQLPAIVLSDQIIGQRRETIDAAALVHEVVPRRIASEPDDSYRRYAIADDGVSPMTVPGIANGMFQTNGLEHDETGRPSAMFVTHERMNAKRHRKLEAIARKYPLFERFGASDPELGILCWGSSAGPVREAVELMNDRGAGVAAFVPRILAPLPLVELNAFLDSCSRALIVETSFAGQFHRYLRSLADLPPDTRVLARSGGKALSVAEIIDAAAILEEVTA
ncbi:MAG TPA: 2-oxoacid:acceptor oxidoreductase subunit alpha [Thermoanaerobaculia bacterium]|nr:2-oxoacid:acceptor oxidoreductase subunit alpha [Thermoanaerobaculia bacterium]